MRKTILLSVVAVTLVIVGLTPVTQQLGFLNTKLQNAEALDATNLKLNVVTKTVPWSYFVTAAGKLSNAATNAGIGNMIISFDGTGGNKMTKVITNTDGSFVAGGVAPNSVANGWTIQAHFAGGATFGASDSNVATYNTAKHNVRLELTISPDTVEEGGSYDVNAQLNDALTNKPLGSKPILFTADSPITIPNANTDSSGAATVSGLTAPSEGSYDIQAHFAGDALYNTKDSQTKVLTVTPAIGPDAYEPNDSKGQAADIGDTNPELPISTINVNANFHDGDSVDWYKFTFIDSDCVSCGVNDVLTVTLSAIPVGSNYDLFVHDDSLGDDYQSINTGNVDEQIQFALEHSLGGGDTRDIWIEVRLISGDATAEEYSLSVTV